MQVELKDAKIFLGRYWFKSVSPKTTVEDLTKLDFISIKDQRSVLQTRKAFTSCKLKTNGQGKK